MAALENTRPTINRRVAGYSTSVGNISTPFDLNVTVVLLLRRLPPRTTGIDTSWKPTQPPTRNPTTCISFLPRCPGGDPNKKATSRVRSTMSTAPRAKRPTRTENPYTFFFITDRFRWRFSPRFNPHGTRPSCAHRSRDRKGKAEITTPSGSSVGTEWSALIGPLQYPPGNRIPIERSPCRTSKGRTRGYNEPNERCLRISSNALDKGDRREKKPRET